ncbi:type II toxin-antitoxin system RelE/ParE family toxin [Klebsiella pneumoniae]|uniref:type II toxin-antitoxin system RelE/ParE family toxin n=1 Tax=Klebsiella pneumoniae TaxID=573 RepID=UPI000DFB0E73|nr:type II toxin-antitoxin system RelE/ParE family toxin [Klebsiella pneumoniae]STS93871.1 Uncharacterised protein [Klebsiella pneumoniae]
MPQVTISALAQRNLQRLQDFLKTKIGWQPEKAGEVIVRAIQQLKNIARTLAAGAISAAGISGTGDRVWRQWLCDALPPRREMDRIVIVTVRHQKESGYPGADSL